MSSDRHDRQRMRRMQKRKRKRIVLSFVVLPLILLMFTAAGYGAFLYKKAETVLSDSFLDDGRGKSPLRDAEVHPLKDNVSILLIGVDGSKAREKNKDFGQKLRSDALMVATLNVEDKSIKLVSIPRDSYVYVPEVEYKTKINHAHAFGGPKATIETVEELLDIPIDYYVRMNFYAFMDVVNALDGIKVNVPYELYEKNSEDKHNAIHLEPGVQILNGEEALALARTRNYDNDIERGKRQQAIMEAVITEAASIKSISKYDEMLEAIGSNMRTNMTFSEMKSLINYGTNGMPDIENITIAGTDGRRAGAGYVYEIDDSELEVLKRKLKRHLDIALSSDEDSAIGYAEEN
ncbi:MAG TPA: LCP family protein [Chondromyces sp.]|nr:LCP family protein [Chondromyces sp.]